MTRNWLIQAGAVLASNLRTLGERKMSSAVAMVGIAGVVTILVGALSMREGFRAALDHSGAKDVAIVLRDGSSTEMSSGLASEQVELITQAHSVKRNEQSPLASAELYVIVNVPLQTTHTNANVPLRGVGAQGPALRSHFKLTKGRMFEPGRFEVIVGRGAAAQFANLEVGKRLRSGKVDWDIVGLFEDAGSVSESEIWTDAGALQSAYQRGNTYQSVRVKLTSASALMSLKDELSTDPRLSVNVMSEYAYYSDQSKTLSAMVTKFGYTVAILMGIGAVFGALNTMYAAVAARTREIAILRALGFGAGPVVSSVIGESMLLGLSGGLIGCVIAYLGFNGIQATTINWASFSQLSFAFAVTPRLLFQGVTFALVLAFIGGVMPGLRAARLPIVSGLREL